MSAPTAKIQYPSYELSGSTGLRYDYAGEKEMRARRDAIAESTSKRLEALYAGDIPAALAAGRRIRALKRSLSGIDPVKVDSLTGDNSQKLGGPPISAATPPAEPPAISAPAAGGGEKGASAEPSAPRVKLPRSRKGLKGPQPTDASMDSDTLKKHSATA